MGTYALVLRRLEAAVILISLFLITTVLEAQPWYLLTANLSGGSEVGSAFVENNFGVDISVSATSQGVNASTAIFPLGYTGGTVFTPPAGKSIIRLRPKTRTTPPTSATLVLLNDGTILIIDFSHYPGQQPTVTEVKKPANAGSLTYFDAKGDAIYLLGGSLFVTSDTGTTWHTDTAGLGSGVYFRDIALDTSQKAYGATTDGLFWQPPDSLAWHKISSLTSPTNLIGVYIDRRNRIFVVGNNNSGVLLSTDNGVTWDYDTAGIGLRSLSNFGDDAFGNIYATGGPGTVYKSAGGTGPWTRVDDGIMAITVNPPAINAIAGDTLVVAATSFGRFVSSDQGTSWSEANIGIQADKFYGFAKNSDRFLVSTDLGIYYRDGADTVWHKSFPESGYLGGLPILKDTSARLYTALPNPDPNSSAMGPVYKSTDNGTTWTVDTMNISATTGKILFVDERGGEHIGSSYVGANYYGFVYAQDSTGKWIFDTVGLPTGSLDYVSSFGTDHAGLIYVSGTYVGSPRVLHRPISGGNWTVDTVGLPSSVHVFYQMKPGAPGEVFGTNYQSIYRHSAGVWTDVPLPTSNVFKFTVDRKGTIFVVNAAVVGNFLSDVGISMSTNNGTSWTMVTHDTVQIDIIHSHGDTSYALLENGVLYTLTNAGVVTKVVNSSQSGLPSEFRLVQNYPNPFNPTTRIEYEIPARSRVVVKIFDVLGQVVQTLSDNVEEAGYKSFNWNASNFASGIYFYRLEATSVSDPGKTFASVKKMILMK